MAMARAGEPCVLSPNEEVPLPPNRPGRLVGSKDGGATRPPPAAPAAPIGQARLRSLAFEEAEKMLPNEVSMMLPSGSAAFKEVAAMCGHEAEADVLWKSLAELLVDLLWAPIAGCIPRLTGLSEDEVSAKVQLFWRCAVALCVMPLAQLSMLSRRKANFLPAVKDHLPPDDASNAVARLAHIRLNLPLFAMVADMPADKKSKPTSPPAEPKPPVEPPQQTAKIAATADCECPLEAEEKLEKSDTAAKHTYDVGYRKWEGFDEDAELRKVDKQRAAPKKHAVDVDALKKKMELDQALDFDDPLKALDQAISQIKKKDTPETSDDAAPEAPLTTEFSEVAAKSESIASTSAPEVKREWVKIPVQEDCEDEEDAPDVCIEEILAPSGSLSKTNTETPKKLDGRASAAATQTDTLTNKYKKWENFDADAASDEEEPTSRPKPAVAKGFLNAKPKASKQAPPKPTPAATKQPATLPSPASSPDTVPVVADSHVGRTTAASLNQEYQRWDQCDDMDEVSDEDGFGGGDMDLDALTGPKDEVRKIQKHWKREAAASQRAAREKSKQSIEKARTETSPALPTGVEVHRPCIYRAESDPEGTAAKAIRRDYDKWKSYDADAVLLGLDNEGKTEEGNAMRCEARKGSAVVSAEGYAKDRDEYELDEDIEKQMGSLKKVIAQRLKDATACKTEGNSLLRDGRAKEACSAYQRGLDTMELCQQACVIMADTMADKNLRLVGDLHRNLAAAQLEVGDWEGTLSSCDAALKLSGDRTSDHGNTGVGADDDKALYRRALALLRLDRQQDARKDIESLATRLGEADPAVKKLRAEDAKQR